MKVSMTSLLIRRDAMTNLPTVVPGHEVGLMRVVHGADNVQVVLERTGEFADLEPANEIERLSGKYGMDAVAKAYGEANPDRNVAQEMALHEFTETDKKSARADSKAPATA